MYFLKKINVVGMSAVVIYYGLSTYVEHLVQKCGGPDALLCGLKRLWVAPGVLILGSPQYPEIWYFIVTLHAIPLYFIVSYITSRLKD